MTAPKTFDWEMIASRRALVGNATAPEGGVTRPPSRMSIAASPPPQAGSLPSPRPPSSPRPLSHASARGGGLSSRPHSRSAAQQGQQQQGEQQQWQQQHAEQPGKPGKPQGPPSTRPATNKTRPQPPFPLQPTSSWWRELVSCRTTSPRMSASEHTRSLARHTLIGSLRSALEAAPSHSSSF